jgi:hypothetical protein
MLGERRTIMTALDGAARAGQAPERTPIGSLAQRPWTPSRGGPVALDDADVPVEPTRVAPCAEIGCETAGAMDPLTRVESRLAWVVVWGSGVALFSMVAAILPF